MPLSANGLLSSFFKIHQNRSKLPFLRQKGVHLLCSYKRIVVRMVLRIGYIQFTRYSKRILGKHDTR